LPYGTSLPQNLAPAASVSQLPPSTSSERVADSKNHSSRASALWFSVNRGLRVHRCGPRENPSLRLDAPAARVRHRAFPIPAREEVAETSLLAALRVYWHRLRV